jgi:hypothetical protein
MKDQIGNALEPHGKYFRAIPYSSLFFFKNVKNHSCSGARLQAGLGPLAPQFADPWSDLSLSPEAEVGEWFFSTEQRVGTYF